LYSTLILDIKYLVFIIFVLSLDLQAQPSWNLHIIDSTSSGADGVKLADINNDGYPDIVTGWEEGNLTKLYLFPETGKVYEKWPSVIVGNTPAVEDAVFIDIDNDGQLDIVSCTEKNSEKIFIHWAPEMELLNPDNWIQEVLPSSVGLMMWMYAEPIQLDGRNGYDLLAAGKGPKASLGWFEAPLNARELRGWHWHQISDVGWIMSIITRDIDFDGDMDIVISDRRGALQGCRWLENPGTGESQKHPWKNHFIGGINLEVMFMCMADVDGDGLEDAIISERSEQTIRIYRRLDEQGLLWEKQSFHLPDITGAAKSVEVGDLNTDGINDFIISTNTNGQDKYGLIWLDGKFKDQPKDCDWKTISGLHNAKFDKIELIDLDEDGDLDILTCEENFGTESKGLGVIWYENPLK